MGRNRAATGPLLLVLLVAALLRAAAIATVGDVPRPHGDEVYYVRAATSLADGAGYPDSVRPPGQPALIALAFALFGRSLAAPRALQAAVALVGIALVFALVRPRYGERAALVSALVCALHPTLVQYTHFLWGETLATTLLLASLWALDRWDASRSARWLVAAGLALGAGVLTRETFLYVVPIAALWVWRGDAAERGRALALLLVPVALVVLPWTARNARLHGAFVLVSTTRWMPMAQGNLVPPDGRLLGDESRSQFMKRYRAIPDELERERYARSVALEAIAGDQPRWLARKLLRNGFLLFSPDGQLRYFARAGWLPPDSVALAARLSAIEAAYYVAQLALGIAALWLVAGGRTKQLVLAVLLLHVAIYVAANANHRFRVPLLPLFALYTGPLLCGAAVRDQTRRWRSAGAAACLAAFLVVVAAQRAGCGASLETGAGGGRGAGDTAAESDG